MQFKIHQYKYVSIRTNKL